MEGVSSHIEVPDEISFSEGDDINWSVAFDFLGW
jgi:hypothetical protein